MTLTKEQLELFSTLVNFLPMREMSNLDPILSKEFLLKNILGMSDKEYKLNEKLLKKEVKKIQKNIKTKETKDTDF